MSVSQPQPAPTCQLPSADCRLLTGRLAPSPTGAQHVGNARTYLIAWLSARSRGGRVVLRIEDIDSPRVKAGAADALRRDLEWLGLDWDGEPMVQTERIIAYEAALRLLQARELVYPCTCTRTDVERAASRNQLVGHCHAVGSEDDGVKPQQMIIPIGRFRIEDIKAGTRNAPSPKRFGQRLLVHNGTARRVD